MTERSRLREYDRAVLVKATAGYPAGTAGAICDLRDGDDYCFFEADHEPPGLCRVFPLLLADLAPERSK